MKRILIIALLLIQSCSSIDRDDIKRGRHELAENFFDSKARGNKSIESESYSLLEKTTLDCSRMNEGSKSDNNIRLYICSNSANIRCLMFFDTKNIIRQSYCIDITNHPNLDPTSIFSKAFR